METTLVGSRFSDIRQRYEFVSGRFFQKRLKQGLFIFISAKNDSKQGSFIVVSAKNNLIQHLFPLNKTNIESFKGGGGAG